MAIWRWAVARCWLMGWFWLLSYCVLESFSPRSASIVIGAQRRGSNSHDVLFAGDPTWMGFVSWLLFRSVEFLYAMIIFEKTLSRRWAWHRWNTFNASTGNCGKGSRERSNAWFFSVENDFLHERIVCAFNISSRTVDPMMKLVNCAIKHNLDNLNIAMTLIRRYEFQWIYNSWIGSN